MMILTISRGNPTHPCPGCRLMTRGCYVIEKSMGPGDTVTREDAEYEENCPQCTCNEILIWSANEGKEDENPITKMEREDDLAPLNELLKAAGEAAVMLRSLEAGMAYSDPRRPVKTINDLKAAALAIRQPARNSKDIGQKRREALAERTVITDDVNETIDPDKAEEGLSAWIGERPSRVVYPKAEAEKEIERAQDSADEDLARVENARLLEDLTKTVWRFREQEITKLKHDLHQAEAFGDFPAELRDRKALHETAVAYRRRAYACANVLQSIEYGGRVDGQPACPVCRKLFSDRTPHEPSKCVLADQLQSTETESQSATLPSADRKRDIDLGPAWRAETAQDTEHKTQDTEHSAQNT